MKLEYQTRSFEIKSADGGDDGAICTFEGLGCCALNLDWRGDILSPGALVQDLPFTKSQGKVRDEHMNTTGRIADAADRNGDLWVKGLILPTAAGNDQAVLLRGKAIDRLSIGYIVLAREFMNSPEEVKAYWATKGYTPSEDDLVMLGTIGGARLLKRVRVYEVSTTWLPVNDKSQITSVKGGQPVGRSFADHSTQVLATVGEYLERAEALAAKRSESGRSISPESKSRLEQLQGRLSTLLASLETKSEAPAAVAPRLDGTALFAQFQATVARMNGVGK